MTQVIVGGSVCGKNPQTEPAEVRVACLAVHVVATLRLFHRRAAFRTKPAMGTGYGLRELGTGYSATDCFGTAPLFRITQKLHFSFKEKTNDVDNIEYL